MHVHLSAEGSRLTDVTAALLSQNYGIGRVQACQRQGFSPFWRLPMSDASDPISKPAPARAGHRRVRTGDQVNQSAADQALMRQLQDGDENAFASFYRRFSPGLFSMIYQILQDQKEAEDVLQEAFVQMWKKSSTYDANRSGLFTWAVMISRNKAIDRLRSRQRRFRTVEAATAEMEVSLPIEVAQADELLGQGEERARVRSALKQLPDPQREAIHLAFFGGMTQVEISDKLQAPLGTVKARIRRGLLALRTVLGEAVS